MELERKVTEGGVFYIDSIDRDIDNHLLVFRFLRNPEESAVCRILTFSAIEDFTEQRDEDFDEQCMESLIGLIEYPEGTGMRYIVTLEDSEMSFCSVAEPVIQEIR